MRNTDPSYREEKMEKIFSIIRKKGIPDHGEINVILTGDYYDVIISEKIRLKTKQIKNR